MSLRSVRAAKARQQDFEQDPLAAFEQNDGLPSWVLSRGFLIPAALVIAILTIIISREVSSLFQASQPPLPQQVSCFMPRDLYLPGRQRLDRRDHFGRGSQTWNSHRRNSGRAFAAIQGCPSGACPPKQAKRLSRSIAQYVKRRAAFTVMYDKDFGSRGVAGMNKLYSTSKDYFIHSQFKDHLRRGTIKMSGFHGHTRQLVWAWTKLPPNQFIPCRPEPNPDAS